jgi:hypothetical protein
LVLVGCRTPGAAPGTATTTAAGVAPVDCPAGKAQRIGLNNFGAYIGTWQASHRQVPQSTSYYTTATVPGRVTVWCSADGYVVAEEIQLMFHVASGGAFQIALTELPADSTKVYDHLHAGCRSLQYQSARLAEQLGADDGEGVADIRFQGDGPAYSAASISLVRIDLGEKLGADTGACA